MKHPASKKHKGFTMMEILVSTSILTFIALAVFSVSLAGQRTYYAGTGVLELQAETRRGFHWLTKELREAASYTITTINSNDDNIVFSTPSKTSVSYFRDTGDANSDGITNQIIREYPSGTRTVVANDVTSLKFVASGNLVQISLVLAKNSGGKQLTLSPKAKVEVRNE